MRASRRRIERLLRNDDAASTGARNAVAAVGRRGADLTVLRAGGRPGVGGRLGVVRRRRGRVVRRRRGRVIRRRRGRIVTGRRSRVRNATVGWGRDGRTTRSARRAGRCGARQPRAAVSRRRADTSARHADAAAHERRCSGVGRERGVRHARQAAAVSARRARLARFGSRVGAGLPGHRAAGNAENVLLTNQRVLIDIARAAIVFGVARRSCQLADGAGGPTCVAVVTATDDIGGIGFAAIADAGHPLDAAEATAIRIRTTHLAGRPTPARRLTDEHPRTMGGTRTAAAIAAASGDAAVGDRETAVVIGARAADLAGHGASGGAGRLRLTAHAYRRALRFGAETAAALEIRCTNIAVLRAVGRTRAGAVATELRAAIRVRSASVAGRATRGIQGDARAAGAITAAALRGARARLVVGGAGRCAARAAVANERAAILRDRAGASGRFARVGGIDAQLRLGIAAGRATVGVARAGRADETAAAARTSRARRARGPGPRCTAGSRGAAGSTTASDARVASVGCSGIRSRRAAGSARYSRFAGLGRAAARGNRESTADCEQ